MASSTKKCCECGEIYAVGSTTGTAGNTSKFLPVNNFIFGDGFIPVCNYCIEKRVRLVYANSGDETPYWHFLDELCQLLNIGFNPSLWEKLHKTHGFKTFIVYSNMMRETEADMPDWHYLNKKYLELQKIEKLDDEIPELREAKIRKLQQKWGANYCEEDLAFLENLYLGILNSQNMSGDLQIDNAKKICKVSLLIDERIRAGSEFDKILGSYDKLVKIADFTPKNSRNAGDFDSVGELMAWLEKRGWVNRYYDGVTSDIVDNTIKNMQSYVRNLYINENSISEEIDRRIEALNHVAALENDYYDEGKMDYDKYELEAYDGPKEEFEEEY